MTRRHVAALLVAALVLLVLQAPLVVRAVRPDVAASLAFLAGAHVDDDLPGVRRTVADPWGAGVWGIRAQTGDDRFYSFGPDGVDAAGRGDDVVAATTSDWRGAPAAPFWAAMLWRWWRTLVVAALGAALVTGGLARSVPPCADRRREVGVSVVVAAPASALWAGWCVVVWERRASLDLAPSLEALEGWSLLPVPITVAGTLFAGATLVVLAWRLGRRA